MLLDVFVIETWWQDIVRDKSFCAEYHVHYRLIPSICRNFSTDLCRDSYCINVIYTSNLPTPCDSLVMCTMC